MMTEELDSLPQPSWLSYLFAARVVAWGCCADVERLADLFSRGRIEVQVVRHEAFIPRWLRSGDAIQPVALGFV